MRTPSSLQESSEKPLTQRGEFSCLPAPVPRYNRPRAGQAGDRFECGGVDVMQSLHLYTKNQCWVRIWNSYTRALRGSRPAFAEAPAHRTRLWEAGLRAGRSKVSPTRPSASKRLAEDAFGNCPWPGRFLKRLHWPDLIAHGLWVSRREQGFKNPASFNPDCPNVGLMKPWRGPTRLARKNLGWARKGSQWESQIFRFWFED